MAYSTLSSSHNITNNSNTLQTHSTPNLTTTIFQNGPATDLIQKIKSTITKQHQYTAHIDTFCNLPKTTQAKTYFTWKINNKDTFTAQITQWQSHTRAICTAIISILLTLPSNCLLTILTTSNTIINTNNLLNLQTSH